MIRLAILALAAIGAMATAVTAFVVGLAWLSARDVREDGRNYLVTGI